MSDVLPSQPRRAGLIDQLRTRAAVGSALALAKLPPHTLRRLLRGVSTGARPASYAEVRELRDTVLSVSAFCRGGSACLVRSLATALLCRSRGLWPEWCVGVLSAPPFTAHAWLEAEGRIVDEPMSSADFAKFFTITATTPTGPAVPTPAEATQT
ncbi:lasso peptide biosynthesis B2 protein [Desertihabitans aurantiacus]|uniref:lasso peptide biosynthesis B2 protein n=1 Tax=Desertihabitans aurantiacus TaxID=2282477 RepID=UPI0018E4F1A4|nr:lasso peptide biosynthesis B2 protein [Desertihabitans aurantiacus]